MAGQKCGPTLIGSPDAEAQIVEKLRKLGLPLDKIDTGSQIEIGRLVSNAEARKAAAKLKRMEIVRMTCADDSLRLRIVETL